ncbi:MAG: hypothetical protein R3F11_25570 [Verrucomicrobiales bacterium]
MLGHLSLPRFRRALYQIGGESQAKAGLITDTSGWASLDRDHHRHRRGGFRCLSGSFNFGP